MGIFLLLMLIPHRNPSFAVPNHSGGSLGKMGGERQWSAGLTCETSAPKAQEDQPEIKCFPLLSLLLLCRVCTGGTAPSGSPGITICHRTVLEKQS